MGAAPVEVKVAMSHAMHVVREVRSGDLLFVLFVFVLVNFLSET